MPLWRQHRQQVPDDQKVEEFEDEQRRQEDERHPITPIERRSVEQRQEIVRTLPGHRFLPPRV
jgi:hypothetical protein